MREDSSGGWLVLWGRMKSSYIPEEPEGRSGTGSAPPSYPTFLPFARVIHPTRVEHDAALPVLLLRGAAAGMAAACYRLGLGLLSLPNEVYWI